MPHPRLLVELGRVTRGFLVPTTQRGARGVARLAGGRRVQGRAEQFPAPGALTEAEPPCEPAAPWSPQTGQGPEGYTARRPLLGRGGGRLVANRPLGVTHNDTAVHGAVLAPVDVLRLEGRMHTWRFPGRATQGIPLTATTYAGTEGTNSVYPSWWGWRGGGEAVLRGGGRGAYGFVHLLGPRWEDHRLGYPAGPRSQASQPPRRSNLL